MNVRVPFVDLRVQHEPLMPELIDAFCRVTESSAFAGGPFVARFESAIRRLLSNTVCAGRWQWKRRIMAELVVVGSRGREMKSSQHPTASWPPRKAISICGARPVFVDIDERTYTMDPARLEQGYHPAGPKR
jgi:dTDP-4-amino-4,6-dideoxygalactose transaminase